MGFMVELAGTSPQKTELWRFQVLVPLNKVRRTGTPSVFRIQNSIFTPPFRAALFKCQLFEPLSLIPNSNSILNVHYIPIFQRDRPPDW